MSLPQDELLSQDCTFRTDQSIRMIQYGDGYNQRGEDGFNSLRRVGSLSWIPLTLAERDEVQLFWTQNGVVQTWVWTAPDDIERVWRFTNGINESNAGDKYFLSVEVQEEFE